MTMICEVADKCFSTICEHKEHHDECTGLSCFRPIDNKWPHICIPVLQIIDVDDLFEDIEI